MLKLFAAITFILFFILTAKADLELGDMTTEDKCNAIISLRDQYRGVVLTEEHRIIKKKLMTWYRQNCSRRRGKAK